MRIKVSIESELAYLPLVRRTIRGICSSVIQNEQVFQDIDLCINEALSNVIHHAYHNESGHEIQILVTLYPQEVAFQIIDLGSKPPSPYLQSNSDKLHPPNEDTLSNLDNLEESGRGLFIIHQLMDEVTYKTENEKNILILRKRF